MSDITSISSTSARSLATPQTTQTRRTRSSSQAQTDTGSTVSAICTFSAESQALPSPVVEDASSGVANWVGDAMDNRTQMPATATDGVGSGAQSVGNYLALGAKGVGSMQSEMV